MWINSDRTLLESRNRDTWQMPLVDLNGRAWGNVTAQIVQPDECMVRYFLVYSPEDERRFLVPTDTVYDIDEKIFCTISSQKMNLLPRYRPTIERAFEQEIYEIIEKLPYWETE